MNNTLLNKNLIIGQGRQAEIYEYEENEVVKLFHKDTNQDDISFEYKMSKFVHTSGLEVPYVSRMIEVGDRKGIVFERLEGKTILETVSKQPLKFVTMAKQMANLHYSIHQVSSLELPSQKERMEHTILNADLLSPPQKEKVIKYLYQLPDENVICHGDFHPDNVMITSIGAKTIDWPNVSRGHHLSDVTRTLLMLKYGILPEHSPTLIKLLDKVGKKQFYFLYLKTYLSLSGDSMNEIKKWEVPVAAARLADGVPDEEKQLIFDRILKEFLE
ncbi:aminoglycoside phosphotransferase family protein [Chengkuizengella axinellae]|uniref:Aminoglycoside phosphotransferase family protein n=1 Tax=Chengkuizengella axinellae TaxID=3064388 RepID=A0ABT9J4K5_9BACL|nr:aminoglycoside phosphotransferase family protein [Chengkuizengella sp. 2205SS18-9]MDP5276531.1 aminoglycoside phosphotransferase family protein [Chengkuizengella sp. 2205SS18-9]